MSAHYHFTASTLDGLAAKYHPNIQIVKVDLTQEAEVATMFQEADKHFWPVQVAVVKHGY